MEKVLITNMIQQLRDIESADLWIDENFEKKLAEVNEMTVFERPLPDMHSIAELMSHLIEWRKEVLSRLHGNPRGLEMTDSANWRTNSELAKKGWKNILQEFHSTQQSIIYFLEGKDDVFLSTPYPYAGPAFPHDYQYLVTGLIHHDLYHLGQMGITIKFLKMREINQMA
ncbi:DinB family protein [Sphingobacterium kitahiroshimense]|uniref:DinB family protein n=1 Tax=Sphingobacterium kitahiroshimense TaxID=470446 RepID=UPI00320A59EA